MNVSVQIQGLDQLAATLATLPEAVQRKVVREALKKGGEPIRAEAARKMARGPEAPHAAEHVGMTMGRSGHALVIGPTKDFYYWLYQEFGTVFHPAQPALRPAFDEESATSLRIEIDTLWKGITKAVELSWLAGERPTR